MKTDDLITMLSANVEAVDPGRFRRVFVFAIAAGAITVIGVTLLTLGSRADFRSPAALGFVFTKLLFAVAVSMLALVYLARLARPGSRLPLPMTLITLPFASIAALAAISLGVAPAAHLHAMLFDGEWLECLLSIPILAIIPFALIIGALRQAAPTHLRGAGALAGLVAGGLSATGYALHCVDDSLPFVAIWYSSTIVLCTLGGAVLGPRLLRW
jgi:hypothetical protein